MFYVACTLCAPACRCPAGFRPDPARPAPRRVIFRKGETHGCEKENCKEDRQEAGCEEKGRKEALSLFDAGLHAPAARGDAGPQTV